MRLNVVWVLRDIYIELLNGFFIKFASNKEPNKRGLPEGHFPVIRHMSIPVFDGDETIAVAGVGNKETFYTDADIRQISLYMNNVWKIIKHNRFLLELEKSEEKFRSVIESSTDALMLVDSNGCIRYANPEAAKLLGESDEECVGMDFGFPMSDGSVGDIDVVDSNGVKHDVEMRVKVIMLSNEKMFLVSGIQDFYYGRLFSCRPRR